MVAVETDYLKFFQSFIASMVQIGGINLPKSVSTMLGRNLGEVYKKRGVTDPKEALGSMFKAMGGESVMFEPLEEETGEDILPMENGFKVTTEYATEFCPIGGGLKPKRHSLFFEGICQPYASAFLASFRPGSKITLTCDRCVLKDGDNKCCIQATFID
ncbi:MAG TPA: hypothetical protein VKM55_27645 [Candidatus Lokiarchaeia archaeon]|nr:hypothetical protein [Candidatus Lokiarchaeia archaeon]